MAGSPSTKSLLRRAGHQPATSDLICAVALQLFHERGYHATSVRDIAAAAGIQPATLYHYFDSKEALLYAISEQGLLELLRLQEQVLNTSDDPVVRLREMARVHVRFHCEHPREAFVSDFELRGLSGRFYDQIMEYRDRYQAGFCHILEEGVQQGVFVAPDAHVMANMLLSLLSGSVLWYRPDGRLPLEEIAAFHATLVLKAVAAFP